MLQAPQGDTAPPRERLGRQDLASQVPCPKRFSRQLQVRLRLVTEWLRYSPGAPVAAGAALSGLASTRARSLAVNAWLRYRVASVR